MSAVLLLLMSIVLLAIAGRRLSMIDFRRHKAGCVLLYGACVMCALSAIMSALSGALAHYHLPMLIVISFLLSTMPMHSHAWRNGAPPESVRGGLHGDDRPTI